MWLGILPEDKRALAAERMHEAVAEAGYRITTGNLTTRYLMDMLAQYGYIEDAWKLITREKYPSWGFMLQNGATTVWERFEFKRGSGMNSHDHPMYGAVGEWFYRYLVEIKPGTDGWQSFCVQPYIPEKTALCRGGCGYALRHNLCKMAKAAGKYRCTGKCAVRHDSNSGATLGQEDNDRFRISQFSQ